MQSFRFLISSLLIAFLFIIAVSCPEHEHIMLRVRNNSGRDFEEVFVVSGEPLVNGKYFGAVATGKTTGYKIFDVAYSYGYVRAISNGEEFTTIPIDYVGETPLSPGAYTYELSLTKSEPPQLMVRCVKD